MMFFKFNIIPDTNITKSFLFFQKYDKINMRVYNNNCLITIKLVKVSTSWRNQERPESLISESGLTRWPS
jgi:hypothetical protein